MRRIRFSRSFFAPCACRSVWAPAVAALVLALSAPVVFLSCGTSHARTEHKVIVLGFDGFDPILAKKWMDEGLLANFARLKEQGDYRDLQSSIPPQSPVAWANFITGMNPGGHRIFDFIHRDPKTYLPMFSTSKTEETTNPLKLGKWRIPLKAGKVELLRQGKAFWEYLEEKGVPCTVFMVPSNFPPVPMKGRSFSGMGTPDMQGTYGMFSFYTDNPPVLDQTVSGGRIYEVDVTEGYFKAGLTGPKNTFLEGSPKCEVPFEVFVDDAKPVAKITIQDQEVLLNEGEWSQWLQVRFEIIPYVKSVTGIVKLYLKQVRPDFKLYITPVNIDPSNPALPICTPEDYSKQIARDIGLFYTQGMSEDTKALDQQVFSDEDYIHQAGFVLEERMKLFRRELRQYKEGFLFFYFSSVDLGSHMFWRTMDPQHPAHHQNEDDDHRDTIRNYYIALDKALGEAMEIADDSTLLMAMSDHGFGPYYRFFHLNTWLKENGYLTLYDESLQGRSVLFKNVDWSRTRLYGLGFNGIYVNQVGRESRGVVMDGPEKDKLLEEVIAKLKEQTDPTTGHHVVRNVYRADRVYSGANKDFGPDLIVGYKRRFRVSWESSLGQFPKALFGDNEKKWSGDHLGDPLEFPGVLFTNRKIEAKAPALFDLPVTILAEYGIDKPSDMVGRSVFEP